MFTATSFVALLEQSSRKGKHGIQSLPQPDQIQSCSLCTSAKLGVGAAPGLVCSLPGSLRGQ